MRTVELRIEIDGEEVAREVIEQQPCEKYELELGDRRIRVAATITDWRWDGEHWNPIGGASAA